MHLKRFLLVKRDVINNVENTRLPGLVGRYQEKRDTGARHDPKGMYSYIEIIRCVQIMPCDPEGSSLNYRTLTIILSTVIRR